MTKKAKSTNTPQVLIRTGLGILLVWFVFVLLFNPAKYFGSWWDEIVFVVTVLIAFTISSAVLFSPRPNSVWVRIAVTLAATVLLGFVVYYSIIMMTIVRTFLGI